MPINWIDFGPVEYSSIDHIIKKFFDDPAKPRCYYCEISVTKKQLRKIHNRIVCKKCFHLRYPGDWKFFDIVSQYGV